MYTKIAAKLLSAVFLAALIAPAGPPAWGDAEKRPVPPMKEWEQEVRARIAKDDKLKALAAKYPLVLLHARNPYADGAYGHSAFSFIDETSDPEKHRNYVQLLWGNGGIKNSGQNIFQTNMLVNQQNLVVNLGKVDFEKTPDFERITIDHPDLAEDGIASKGHVYLERVRDTDGNNFYVLFQVVAVERDGRYIAFLWRKVPGGKVVKRADQE